MKLAELEPQFIKIVADDTYQHVGSIAEADGIFFLCPKCFETNKGKVGTHGCICWMPHVPQTRDPKPGRWSLVGSGYSDLTLVAGSSSVALVGGCNAHFFITKGDIQMC